MFLNPNCSLSAGSLTICMLHVFFWCTSSRFFFFTKTHLFFVATQTMSQSLHAHSNYSMLMLSGIRHCFQIDSLKATYRLHLGKGRWRSRRRCCPCAASVRWPSPGRAVEGPQIQRLSGRGWGMHLGGEILETSGRNVETIGDFVHDVCALHHTN